MQSSIFVVVFIGLLLNFIQCEVEKSVREYELKEVPLTGGRGYDIKSVTNAPHTYSIRNELFSVGKKLFLLEDGKERYSVKHELLNLMSTWTINDAVSGRELGVIKNKAKFIGSKIEAHGEFGNYKIKGNYGQHDYVIFKDKHKVAKINKKQSVIRDKYDLTVYENADPALMVLFAVIVDEIRQH